MHKMQFGGWLCLCLQGGCTVPQTLSCIFSGRGLNRKGRGKKRGKRQEKKGENAYDRSTPLNTLVWTFPFDQMMLTVYRKPSTPRKIAGYAGGELSSYPHIIRDYCSRMQTTTAYGLRQRAIRRITIGDAVRPPERCHRGVLSTMHRPGRCSISHKRRKMTSRTALEGHKYFMYKLIYQSSRCNPYESSKYENRLRLRIGLPTYGVF